MLRDLEKSGTEHREHGFPLESVKILLGLIECTGKLDLKSSLLTMLQTSKNKLTTTSSTY